MSGGGKTAREPVRERASRGGGQVNRRRWSRAVMAAGAAVMAALLSGCAHQGQRTLKFGMFSDSNWEIPDDKSARVLEEAVAGFDELHPELEIEYESGMQKADYSEWLAGQLLEGTAPDVFVIAEEDFVSLAAKGALLNLEELIEKDDGFRRGDYYDAVLESGQYEQQQYALPWECNLTLMGVNTDLLESNRIDLPTNSWLWSDFHAICRLTTKDTDKNGKLDQFGFCDYTWKDAAYSNGAVLFDKMGTMNYMGDWKVINAVNFLYRLEMLNEDMVLQHRNFEDGNVVFCPMRYSDFRTYKTYPWKIERYTDFDWTCVTMPAGPQGDNISELETLLIGINAASPNREAAWELLKFISYGEETQGEVAQRTMCLPVLREAVERIAADTREEEEPGISAALTDEILSKAVAVPQFRKYETALSMCSDGVAQATDSEKNIPVSMIMLQREINNYLNNG